jgi:hypothetical protein
MQEETTAASKKRKPTEEGSSTKKTKKNSDKEAPKAKPKSSRKRQIVNEDEDQPAPLKKTVNFHFAPPGEEPTRVPQQNQNQYKKILLLQVSGTMEKEHFQTGEISCQREEKRSRKKLNQKVLDFPELGNQIEQGRNSTSCWLTNDNQYCQGRCPFSGAFWCA